MMRDVQEGSGKFFSAYCLVVFLSMGLLPCSGCREDQGIPPPSPSSAFVGITSTDASGNIISTDSSDWKPLPIVGTSVAPAFPNPCSATFILLFRMTASDSIDVTLNLTSSTVWENLASGRYGPGQFEVTGHVESAPPGIYRVYFNVIRQGTTYTTFGDVQVGG